MINYYLRADNWECAPGLVANVLDSDNVVSEFEMQLRSISDKCLRKRHGLSILTARGLKVQILFYTRMNLALNNLTKVDMT